MNGAFLCTTSKQMAHQIHTPPQSLGKSQTSCHSDVLWMATLVDQLLFVCVCNVWYVCVCVCVICDTCTCMCVCNVWYVCVPGTLSSGTAVCVGVWDASCHAYLLTRSPPWGVWPCLVHRPRTLPVQGFNLENVFVLRDPSQANQIASLAEGKNVVVIGTSFIGERRYLELWLLMVHFILVNY